MSTDDILATLTLTELHTLLGLTHRRIAWFALDGNDKRADECMVLANKLDAIILEREKS